MTKRVIYKYELTSDDCEVPVPKGAPIITMQFQRGPDKDSLCVWALVDPTQPMGKRHFKVYGTGEVFDLTPQHIYLGTAQNEKFGGSFVWHVFEVIDL